MKGDQPTPRPDTGAEEPTAVSRAARARAAEAGARASKAHTTIATGVLAAEAHAIIAESRAQMARTRIELRRLAARLAETAFGQALIRNDPTRQPDPSSKVEEIIELSTTLIATISHDLRGPLGAIGGLAQTLLDRGDLVEAELRDEVLSRIVQSTTDVQKILDQMLDVMATQKIKREETELSALAIEVVGSLDVGDHPVTIDEKPETGFVDRTLLRRIIRNLVVNTCRHTPRGTPMWIRFDRTKDGIELIFDDAGPGISDHAQDAVDSWAPGVGTPSTAGLGLGLHLVHRLASHHGGRVWFGTRTGGGASIHVLLSEDEQSPT